MLSKPNKLRIPYALSVYGDEEQKAVLKVMSEHKTGLGEKTFELESRVSKLFGKKYGVMVNSGSTANLLSIELMDLPKGSQVITPVLTFSTTVAPLIQKGLVPIFVDVAPGNYLIDIEQVEETINGKVSALVIPSLLGNVPDLPRLNKIASANGAYLIEDSCDTLGATFNDIPTGKYTDISTTSFYGSHVITAGGGGGMLCMNNKKWYDRARILRGWGRSSAIDESETLDKRFGIEIDGIPYDSKFVFEEIGYNFLPLEISAAFGVEQVKKLNKFFTIRNRNFTILKKFFAKYSQYFVLPKQLNSVKTSWLAFPLTIKPDAPFSRIDIVTYLERNNVQTRPIFTGNILRQPGFSKLTSARFSKAYPVADNVMKNGFVIGCNHGLTNKHMARLIEVLSTFLNRF